MSNIAWPDLVTKIYADERFKLGTERVETPQEVNASDSTHYGARTWVFVKTTAALAKGEVVTPATGTGALTPFVVIQATAAGAKAIIVQGIAQHAITLAKPYGWVVKNGMCEVLCDGDVTGRASIVTDSVPGKVTNMAAGQEHAVIGVALEDDGITTPDLVTAIVRCGA